MIPKRLPISEEEPTFVWFEVRFKMRARNADSALRTVQRMMDASLHFEDKQLLFASSYAPRDFSAIPVVEEGG